jgi:hypothetical protein
LQSDKEEEVEVIIGTKSIQDSQYTRARHVRCLHLAYQNLSLSEIMYVELQHIGHRRIKNPPFTLEEAVAKIHEIAKESENVFFLCSQAKDRAKQRKASSKQIFDVLRHGEGVDGPNLDKHGDWRVKLKYYTCGRPVQVVVVFNEKSLVVVTVI